jgi:gamma-glutamyltranspeptidase/glutathione hydrolase
MQGSRRLAVHRFSHWVALFALLVGCSAAPVEVQTCGPVALPQQPTPVAVPSQPWTVAQMALPQVAQVEVAQTPDGHHFAAATAHPLATRAAADVLRKGGTAVDALVAASFMLTVVVPQSTGIGGGGFAIVQPGDARQARAYDFRETAPAAMVLADYLTPDGKAIAERSQHHGLAVATPGYVAGLWRLHRRFGSLPWAQLVQPAVDTARRGFPVGRDLARCIALVQQHLNAPALRVFLKNGQPLKEGETLVQERLAATLQRIADDGPTAFYAGAIAEDIVATTQAAGGKLAMADLLQFDTREFAPLAGRVAGLDMLTMPQPSAGGAQVLAMAEAFTALPMDMRSGADPNKLAHAFAEVMRRSYALRLAYSGDAAKPAKTLDDAFPAMARELVNAGFDGQHATPTAKLPALPPGKAALPDGKIGENHQNTSHVAIVDGSGMAVSSTHTVNLQLGSGLMTEGGIVLNNEMDDFTFALDAANYFGLAGSAANLAKPGARPVSSMSPSIVLKDGQPLLVLGSPGGTKIPTTVFQVLARHLLLGQPLAAAVAAVRVHHQAKPDNVLVEEAPLGDALVKGLESRGHEVKRLPAWCNVQAVRRACGAEKRCVFEAVSDPRAEGGAVAE